MSSILELFLDHLVYERNLVEIRLHKRGIDLPESFWTGLSFPITGADLKKAFPRELATMEQSCVRRINVRLNRSQAHRLACLARLYKMTRSAWVRHALHHPCPPITKERTLRFLTDLRRFRGNLTQLVRHRVFPHHCARLKIETEAVEGFFYNDQVRAERNKFRRNAVWKDLTFSPYVFRKPSFENLIRHMKRFRTKFVISS